MGTKFEINAVITSTKESMFSSALVRYLFCLLFSGITRKTAKNYSIYFHKIRWIRSDQMAV